LGHAQNRQTFHGNILRIDIDNRGQQGSYAIPPDNPFAGNDEGYLEEIYAYGLRNPWRFSFDPVTGLLWAGDVGQNAVEEINIIEKGKNYGWNIMEGSQCYNPPTGCDPTGLEMPVYEYLHPLGRSITGGYVYRGSELPLLKGAYIYADFVTGLIWALWHQDGEVKANHTIADTGLTLIMKQVSRPCYGANNPLVILCLSLLLYFCHTFGFDFLNQKLQGIYNMWPDIAADENKHNIVPDLEITFIKPHLDIENAIHPVGFCDNGINLGLIIRKLHSRYQ